MRKTIKDIANYTGLSITTISLVLNDKENRIPQKTKDRIFEAVKELNYSSNKIAVGLKKKRTYTIGLIIPDISNTFFSILAKGVEDACRKVGWNLILCNTNEKHSYDMQYIQVLADKGMDGILYTMASDSDDNNIKDSIHLMENLNIPFVMIDRYVEGENIVSIATDHIKGGYLATKHLIDLGHKNIACITGPLNLIDSQNRLLGYKQALEKASIAYNPELIFEGMYTLQSGAEAIKFLSGKQYTAIFAFNDMSAFGAYKELNNRNINVPNDISLIGYDNIFFSNLLNVPLTTINQPIYEIGIEATKLLVNKESSANNKGNHITLEPEIIIRSSTKKII